MPKPAAQDDLIEEAWRVITDALHTGKPVLKNGAVLELKAGDVLDVARWLASLKARPKRAVSLPEDFMLGKPEEKGDAKAPEASAPAGNCRVEGPPS